jgi:hypothetical protein
MPNDRTRKGRCEEAIIAHFNVDTLNKEKESRLLTSNRI